MHFGGSPFIRGIDGRQIDPATNRPFELGSPYAVKDYFAVMPLMASGLLRAPRPPRTTRRRGALRRPGNISAGCPGDADAVREWTEPWDRVGTAPLNGDANKHMVDGVVPAYDASDFDPGPSLAGPRSCASCGSRPGSNTVSSARRWLPTANCWSRLSTVRSTSMN
jgi:hypothetical protein